MYDPEFDRAVDVEEVAEVSRFMCRIGIAGHRQQVFWVPDPVWWPERKIEPGPPLPAGYQRESSKTQRD